MDNSKHTALLVVDVQKSLFEKSNPVYKADQLLDNILSLVAKAHAAGAPVFYIQHCDQRDLARDTAGWQLHPRLQPVEKDIHLFKEKSNSFEGTDLDEKLKSLGVTSVVVTGLVTHGCVKNGCLGAKELGYKVTLARDAHSNFSAKASQMIEEWNEKLRLENIELKPAAEISFN
jgi:nicotinamidase-related amidase